MSSPVGRSSDSVPILRMFEKTAPRLIDVAAVRVLFDKFVTQVAEGLNEFAPVVLTARLEQLDQGPTGEFLQATPRVLTVAGSIAEWGATAFVRIDPMLLFRLLDAMYGGDPNRPSAMPTRPLTNLEAGLAVRLASVIVAKLSEVLSGLCTFTFHGARLVDAAAEVEIAGSVPSVLIAMSIVETGEQVGVIMPAGGLELIREKTQVKDEGKSEPGIDPEWAAGFKKGVLTSTVPLSAVIDGPAMTINDVARLRVGSVVELDSDALKRVRIESDAKPIFVGQLGQGRGVFTVLLEDVIAGPRGNAA